MKSFLEKIPRPNGGFAKFLAGLACIFTVLAIALYSANYYVIIRFKELGPLSKNMSAYYNGFKIGKITQIKPDKDFKHILVKVKFNQNDINLPKNMVVYVERFPSGELYLQFMYPPSPSLQLIKRGDILEGVTSNNLEQFMMGQSVSGMSDIVSLHIIKALNAADAANQEMTVFFKLASNIMKNNDEQIDLTVRSAASTMSNLNQMAQNLNSAAQRLNTSLGGEALNGTTSGINETAENIARATKDFDKTMKKVDDTVSELNSTAKNLNSITSGVNQALSKRFGGMRVMFGSPTKPSECEKCPCQ